MAAIQNPCCAEWQNKCKKMEERRNALRTGLTIMKDNYDKVQAENDKLKKALEEQRTRAGLEKDLKEEESPGGNSQKNKACIHCQKLKKELKTLEEKLLKKETETDVLRKDLTKEKRRADLERENAEIERHRAEEMKQALAVENNRANECSRTFDCKARSAGDSDMEETILKYKKLAEGNEVKVIEERSYADNLLKQLQEEMAKVERLSRENEELISLRDSDQSGFTAQLSETEVEVKQLKNLLKMHKAKADSEQEKASETLEKKSEEFLAQMNVLKKGLNEAKLESAAEKSKYEDLIKKFEREKQKVIEQKQLADSEKVKALDLKRHVEANERTIVEEKSKSNHLLNEVKEERQKVEKLEKKLQELMSSKNNQTQNFGEAYKKLVSENKRMNKETKVMEAKVAEAEMRKKLAEEHCRKAQEEKCQADNLFHQLEKSKQSIQELQEGLTQVKVSQGLTDPSASFPVGINASKMNFLCEQLKFEKNQLEHSKQVAKFERDKNNMLQQELGRLKHYVVQILQHMDVLTNACCSGTQAVNGPEKTGDLINLQSLYVNHKPFGLEFSGLPGHGPVISCSCAGNISDCVDPTMANSKPDNGVELTSGIRTKLHPLVGGSHREISPSSAMNFSDASFSNKQVLGSQETVAGSLAASTRVVDGKPILPQTVSNRSSEMGKRKCTDHLTIVDENVACHLGDIPALGRKKRRKICDDSELTQYEVRTLHHLMEKTLSKLNKRFSKRTVGKRQLGLEKQCSPASCDISCKKGNTVYEIEAITENVHGIGEQRKTGKLVTPSPLPVVGVESHQACQNSSGSAQIIDQDLLAFERLFNGSFMNLLNLDNAVDEELYQMAIKEPLSPALPEVNCNSSVDVDPYGCSVDAADKTSISTSNEPSSRSIPHGPSISCLGKNGARNVNGSIWMNNSKAGINPQQIDNSKAGSHSEIEYASQSSGGDFRGAIRDAPLFCVVFSDAKEISSTTRMFSTLKMCLTHCTLMDMLTSLASEEELTAREKLCVCFSLFLQNYFQILSIRLEDDLDLKLLCSLSTHLCSALSVMENRQVFFKLCDLGGLLYLFEDFVRYRRIMVLSDMSSGSTHNSDSSFDIIINGQKTRLCSGTALTHHVVAGSVIFSSICSAVGQIGTVWEASFSILQMWWAERQLMLCILHAFAHAVEMKELSLTSYSLPMAVITSILRFVQSASRDVSIDAGQDGNNALPHFPKCAGCPILGDPQPIDIASMLVEQLKRYASENSHLTTWGQNSDALISCNSSSPFVTVDSSSYLESEYLCSSTDVMSIVELISTIMGWDWTANKILPDLLKLLEVCIPRHLSTSLVLLLGYLGRFGVKTSGHEDAAVNSIVRCLKSVLGRISLSECKDVLVAATVSALDGIYGCGRSEELCQSSCSGTKFMSNCHSSLSRGQKALLSSFQHPLS